MFFEDLDDDHGCATGFTEVGTGGGMVVRDNGFYFLCIDTRVIDNVIGTFNVDEVTQSLHVFDPDVIGKQTVVTDAMKTPRQDVYEKAAHELIGGQGHGFVLMTPFGPIVFPREGDAAFVASDEPAVADGDPMGVARQVGKHGFGPGEGSLGIDHPVDVA